MARGRRCQMEGRRRARFRLVSRQQRSVLTIGRPGDRQLPRWLASRSRQRKPGWRIRRVLSARPRGNAAAGPRCGDRRENPGVACTRFAPESARIASAQTREGLVTNHISEPAGSVSAARSRAGRRAAIQAGDRAAGSQSDRQDACEPHRRAGPGAGSRNSRQPAGRGAGELPGAAPQPAGEIRGAGR